MTGDFSFSFFHPVFFSINKQYFFFLNEERKWPVRYRLHDQPRNDLHNKELPFIPKLCSLPLYPSFSECFLKKSSVDKAAILPFNLSWLHVHVLSHFSPVRLFATLWTAARQAPLSMGFSRQEHWSGYPCPSPWDLPDPGIEPASLMSPASASGFFTTSAT